MGRVPVFLLACGLVSMVGVALQSSAYLRLGQMALIMAAAAFSGKRVKILPPAVMLATVVLANVLVPNGRVLFAVGRMVVTLGALETGLLKGSLLVGMIYISRLSVTGNLRLPGRFGSLLAESFAYFEALNHYWPETSGRLIPRLDELLILVHKNGAEGAAPEKRREGSTQKKLITGTLLVVVSWTPLAF